MERIMRPWPPAPDGRMGSVRAPKGRVDVPIDWLRGAALGGNRRIPRPTMHDPEVADLDVRRGRDNRRGILVTTPVRITATGAQELRLALDVSAYDVLDLELRVLRLEGTSPSVTVEIQTGMQRESSEGWVTLGTAFPAVATAPKSEVRNLTNLLRYIRWNVTVLSGSGSPAATFMIDGVGRGWA